MSARQENLETIHQHNVVAERYGTLGEVRAEMRSGQLAPRHTEMRSLARGVAGPTGGAGCYAPAWCEPTLAPSPRSAASRRRRRRPKK